MVNILIIMGTLILGIYFVAGDSRGFSHMSEYDLYGEEGEDEWTRRQMGMTDDEYKEFMGGFLKIEYLYIKIKL
jgi:hypothetical protein